MRVLVTGGSSLLGKALLETAPESWQVESTWFTNYVQSGMLRLDITDANQVKYVVSRIRPEAVIHCAGIAAVDYAELYWQETRLSNVEGTKNLLDAARALRAKFVYVSTNAVFDGEHAPYAEGDERNPISQYGRLKKDAEDLVMKEIDWIIVRPILLYGWPWLGGRQNWVTRTVQSLSSGLPLKLVDDTATQPTSATFCAEAIWRLLAANEKKVYHVGGADVLNLHDLGVLVARVFGLDEKLISRAKSSDFPTLAPRPKDTTYRLDKLRSLGIEPPSLREGLKTMRRQRNEQRVNANQFQVFRGGL